jgi:hypothetical protein
VESKQYVCRLLKHLTGYSSIYRDSNAMERAQCAPPGNSLRHCDGSCNRKTICTNLLVQLHDFVNEAGGKMHFFPYFAILLSVLALDISLLHVSTDLFLRHRIRRIALSVPHCTVRKYFSIFLVKCSSMPKNVSDMVRFFIYRHLHLKSQAARFKKCDKTESGLVYV